MKTILAILVASLAFSPVVTADDDLSKTSVIIKRDFLQAGTISPYQYGQFIEYLCNVVPSMWAEKLYDGCFEGLSPYKVVYLKETDFRERPWYPAGATQPRPPRA